MVPWRCIWLPPVVGTSMAAWEEVQEQLRLRGLANAWLDVEELPALLARELFCGTSAHALWARVLPELPSVHVPAPLSNAAAHGLAERPDAYPSIFPLSLLCGANPVLEAGRNFSAYVDRLETTKAVPLTSVLQSLCETGNLTAPWLHIAGMDHIHVQQDIVCLDGVTREGRISTTLGGWQNKEEHQSMTLYCPTELTVRGISANGRRTEQWEPRATATILLSPEEHIPSSPWGIGTNAPHEDYCPLQSKIVPITDIAQKNDSRYSWVWLSVNHMLSALLEEHQGYTVHHINKIRHMSTLQTCSSVRVEWRVRYEQEKILAQGQVTFENGTVLLAVKGMSLTALADGETPRHTPSQKE